MSRSEYVLELLNITKEFPGVRALNDVTFRLRPGTVHALMGENGAGKSTLMKCLFGIYAKDSGTILHNGQEVNYTSTLAAINDGVSMIHQELYPEPHLSVQENVWLGRLPTKHGMVDYKKMNEDTRKLFENLKMDLDPKAVVRTLTVSKMQSIEIAKAVSHNAEVIIMDEPTSSLTENEVEHLFNIIDDLRSRGVAIVYISHKMEEIKRIADEISIMRDGKMIGTWPAAELTTDDIISKMVGRDMSNRFPPKTNTPGDVVMTVEDFTSVNERSFQNVSFQLRRGEVLGVGENIYIASYKRIAKFLGYIDSKTCNRLADQGIEQLNVKTPSAKTPINSLSGGNQQKALFARWLLTEPNILLLDEPTRGIDVGAKYEIYKIINELATQGKSIIVISSEMPELMGMADRIMVMCEGKMTGIVEGEEVTEENIMRLATKYMV